MEGLVTPASSEIIRRHLGCNSVKSGGPTFIAQHNPQQFHGWNQMEILM